MEEYLQYVKRLRVEQLIIKNLVSNQDYQRRLWQQHIDKTALNFDVHQINPPKISFRDGQYFVINGQHTIEVIAKVTGSRDVPVWCIIFDDLTYEQEAYIFANQQKFCWGLSPYDGFKACIEAGEDRQIIINGIVENCGLKVGPSRSLCSICAVSGLEWIYDKYGYDVLGRTLRLVVGAWEGDADSLSATMLRGIAHLLASFGDQVRDDAFSERLGMLSPREIIRDGKLRNLGYLGYSEVMLFAYNRGHRSNLPTAPLHSHKSKYWQETQK